MERNPYLTEREQREIAELEQLLRTGERANAREASARSQSHPRAEPPRAPRPN